MDIYIHVYGGARAHTLSLSLLAVSMYTCMQLISRVTSRHGYISCDCHSVLCGKEFAFQVSRCFILVVVEKFYHLLRQLLKAYNINWIGNYISLFVEMVSRRQEYKSQQLSWLYTRNKLTNATNREQM